MRKEKYIIEIIRFFACRYFVAYKNLDVVVDPVVVPDIKENKETALLQKSVHILRKATFFVKIRAAK